ncbi:increased recombination centers protein 6 [Metschnikowia bicuspidata var. bicuspidata NRRL YB-4993]|uniref:Increased recombination centers protein 6 n=1 Tax=Metschnikowia bicuspidata var. bicuspidata NRRL YB-4993 TaxID=869754 RepID=A0A1A0HH95_9ASCO|nr:increased recombination centers protein 6 [Metschnikowia bicuspidata var. bicuspidata NRRL YB-4993]OBA23371.1 increased recombination centers protein 6 [Metschnikowia bicuspidata var. bicuspidata NRRL YB-4993]
MQSNNVLIIGPPHTGKIRIAQHITKDLDTSTIQPDSHSGLIYNYKLRTKYFTLDVNLLVEEYPDSRASQSSNLTLLQTFLDEFKSPEFTELRDALDGLVFTIKSPIDDECLSETLALFVKMKELLEDNDIFLVVVDFIDPIHKSLLDITEDEVIAHGFEYVNFHELGTNEYAEKIGKDRLVEIFHTHEWSHSDKPMSNEAYTSRKKDKLGPMTKGLMDEENDRFQDQSLPPLNQPLAPMDLDVLLTKLNLDKLRAQEMNDEDKKAFIEDLVDDYMEYF